MNGFAVAVVSWETREALRACLRSVAADGASEVIVVDNGSRDGSAAAARETLPAATVLVDPANPGFGGGANRALAATTAPYVLLLNADTIVRPGALAMLTAALDAHPRAGVVGPRLLHPDGTLQPSCAPFLGTARLALEKSPLGAVLARVPWLRRHWLLLRGSHDRPRSVPWVLGAAMALRREAVLAVGGFDPEYFMYAEEVDLCWRLRAAGWDVRFAPDAEVVHMGGAATTAIRPAMAARRVASARRFYRRHYGPFRVAVLEAAVRTAMGARYLRDAGRLRVVRDGARRRRLREDVAVWRAALAGEQHGGTR